MKFPMPKRKGANGSLFAQLITDGNLYAAIAEVNKSHHWLPQHRPNPCTAWVELNKAECVKKLRAMLIAGFKPSPPRVTQRYDASARKTRTISEPRQWPDQYVHHALIQVLQPIMMRGMDVHCCGSIRGRGTHYAMRNLQSWVNNDPRGTTYCLSADIYHFYDSLTVETVMARMRRLIKDGRVLALIQTIVEDGIRIGYYTSQWFANTVLQPLDALIRRADCTRHYLRYMDNITVFGTNKRKLRKLKDSIEQWLHCNALRLKGNWQVFRVARTVDKYPLPPPRRGVTRPAGRLPDAVGYRYGRGFMLPRKHTLLRLKRALHKYYKLREQGRCPTYRLAAGLLARIGQLKHCNNTNLYAYLFHGRRVQRELKQVVKWYGREEYSYTWNMYLAQVAAMRPS